MPNKNQIFGLILLI